MIQETILRNSPDINFGQGVITEYSSRLSDPIHHWKFGFTSFFEHPTYRRKLAIRNNLLYKDSHQKYYVQILNDMICHIYNLIGPILSSG